MTKDDFLIQQTGVGNEFYIARLTSHLVNRKNLPSDRLHKLQTEPDFVPLLRHQFETRPRSSWPSVTGVKAELT
ncbi:hypothetical protein C0J52_13793 [Blattella germanica]|nr:hypothetical protein C0J52_13793 [Blattella germanica]